jgi:hypothetical protein
MGKSLKKQLLVKRFLGEVVGNVYPNSLASMRVFGVLQGRLSGAIKKSE